MKKKQNCKYYDAITKRQGGCKNSKLEHALCWRICKNFELQQSAVVKSVCDVCGSDDIIEAPHIGKNCNRCHPL